jgi:hypothetical protein
MIDIGTLEKRAVRESGLLIDWVRSRHRALGHVRRWGGGRYELDSHYATTYHALPSSCFTRSLDLKT